MAATKAAQWKDVAKAAGKVVSSDMKKNPSACFQYLHRIKTATIANGISDVAEAIAAVAEATRNKTFDGEGIEYLSKEKDGRLYSVIFRSADPILSDMILESVDGDDEAGIVFC